MAMFKVRELLVCLLACLGACLFSPCPISGRFRPFNSHTHPIVRYPRGRPRAPLRHCAACHCAIVPLCQPFNMPLQSSRGSSKRTQKAIFNEQDPVWVKLRHLHFLDAYSASHQHAHPHLHVACARVYTKPW